jgi:predicted DCC family thiol-disulfide oxidoreductase YuxK
MTDHERTQIEGHPVILYDGVCALCNGVVRYLLHHDHDRQFRFVPQQTPLAEELLAAFPAPSLSVSEGVILLTAALTSTQRLYRRSDAVDQAMRLIPGPLSSLAKVARLIPRALRELAYGVIARHRYRLFGKYSTCPIPSPDQRERILGIH